MTTTHPPGPPGLSIWGYLKGTHRDRLAAWARLRAEYGDLVHGQLFRRHFYLINTPELARAALVEHSDAVRRIPLGERLTDPKPDQIAGERDYHRRWRKLLQPAFQPANLAPYAPLMTQMTDSWVAQWPTGAVLDIAHEMNSLTLRIVARALFDADVSDSADAFSRAVTLGSEYLAQPGRLPLPTPRNLRLLGAWMTMVRAVETLVAQRRAEGPRGDVLSTLLSAVDADDGFALDDTQAKSLMIALFIAGHETTAIALTWALDLIARHPAVEARLRDELTRTLGDALPTADVIGALPYTGAVLRETMRLYPPAWVLTRQVVGSMTLAGYSLPSGSLLLISPYVMQRDPRYFAAPEQFDPDRWLSSAEPPRYAYLPFGGGPYVCLGQFFAQMEMVLVLATLMQRARLRALTPHAPDIEPLITLRPAGVVRLAVERG